MINRVNWYFLNNNRQDLCIELDVDYLLKPVEERQENKINELYDNLLIL